jgi:alpha-glucosidase
VSLSSLAKPAGLAATDAEWWRGAAIYQVYPLSFADSNGDGFGDLQGVTARLDYIRSLGVDAVWISPFFKSPMRDFGYDVADYCDVDPLFGALADFDALIARAHALGLKLIIDQVYSHTSDEHAWFKQSRASRSNSKADWYVWADARPDGSPPCNWQSVFGGPSWTWDARRRQYYLHNFLAQQPDLNVHNPEVQEALLATLRFWFERGVDGLRLDAANFLMHDPALTDNPPVQDKAAKRTRPFDFQHHFHNQSHPAIPAFLTRLRQLADSYGGRFLLAEVGGERSDAEMKLYTEPPERLHSAYDFHYLYADALSPAVVRECAALWQGGAREGWPSWSFSNHDAPRAVSRWAHGRDVSAVARLNLMLLAALRGNIFIYQGEELGLPQARVPFEQLRDPEAIANWPLTLGRDGARTPMPWRAGARNAGFSEGEPWLPLDPEHVALAVDAQELDENATLHVARRMIEMRRRRAVLRGGDMAVLDAPDPILLFRRGQGGDAVLCAFNLGANPAPFALPEGWRAFESVNQDGAAAGALAPLAGVMAERS